MTAGLNFARPAPSFTQRPNEPEVQREGQRVVALFVHPAVHEDAGSIRRSEITRLRRWGGPLHGIYALPVRPDFVVTHLWLRALKRRNGGLVLGVCFRIPDDEPVWVGHYRGPHRAASVRRAGM